MFREGSGYGHLFIEALYGEPGGGFVYRGLSELNEGAVGMGHLSLKRLRGGDLGEGSFNGKPER